MGRYLRVKIVEPEEAWLPVVGYEGCYEVSNFGRIRCVNIPSRGLNRGYHSFNLTNKDGHVKTHRLHTLIAATFLGERPEGFVIHHVDGNKLNNNADNLQYVSQGQNVRTWMMEKKRKGDVIQELTRRFGPCCTQG